MSFVKEARGELLAGDFKEEEVAAESLGGKLNAKTMHVEPLDTKFLMRNIPRLLGCFTKKVDYGRH